MNGIELEELIGYNLKVRSANHLLVLRNNESILGVPKINNLLISPTPESYNKNYCLSYQICISQQ